MSEPAMATRIAAVFAARPEIAHEFYCMASEIVDDFDDYGPVIQANDAGEYDATTTIIRLRAARDAVIDELRESREP